MLQLPGWWQWVAPLAASHPASHRPGRTDLLTQCVNTCTKHCFQAAGRAGGTPARDNNGKRTENYTIEEDKPAGSGTDQTFEVPEKL